MSFGVRKNPDKKTHKQNKLILMKPSTVVNGEEQITSSLSKVFSNKVFSNRFFSNKVFFEQVFFKQSFFRLDSLKTVFIEQNVIDQILY